MHFSGKFNVSPVKVTCRGWSFECEGDLLRLEQLTCTGCPSVVLQFKECIFDDSGPPKFLREARSKEDPRPTCPIRKLPETLSVSSKYRNV